MTEIEELKELLKMYQGAIVSNKNDTQTVQLEFGIIENTHQIKMAQLDSELNALHRMHDKTADLINLMEKQNEKG